MPTSISGSQLPASSSVTRQSPNAAVTTSGSSEAASTKKASFDTVTLSDRAHQIATHEKTWSSMSLSELKGVYDRTWNSFVQYDESFARQGAKVFYQDVRTTGTPEEMAFSKKIADYMVSIHSQPPTNVANPYAGAPRDVLISIMYDESGKYTISEREAAGSEQGKQDYAYLSNWVMQLYEATISESCTRAF